MENKRFPEGLSAALIDMDGVLYDSMPYHTQGWYKMFAEAGIVVDDPNEFYLYEGMTGGDTIRMIIKRELGRDTDEDEIKRLYARKVQFFMEAGGKKKMPYADKMLEAFRDAGIDTVLVTGSAQASLIESLTKDYPGYFSRERMVTAFDVTHGKPNPEPYLKGLQKAGADVSKAVVVENAPLGVRAGKAAGCFTIAVTTGPIPREAFEKEGADMIFPTMQAFAVWLKDNLKKNPARRLDKVIADMKPDKVLVVTDSTVEKLVLPKLSESEVVSASERFILPPGEDGKNISSVIKMWEKLEEIGATRKSVVVNIGGGMVTDAGGFAAATYKRGIRTVNFPTTLLGAVDAATGGKTGVNFQGLKNEIGAFHNPSEVIISSLPLSTLPHEEFMSGYAEMLKTGLIADKSLYIKLSDIEKMENDPVELEAAMKRCVEIKEDVVAQDPRETGLRKILNFGHTAGHAFESLAFKTGKPVAHGVAVAHGMLVELILSHTLKGFPGIEVSMYADNILKPYYRRLDVRCNDLPALIELMAHDKKNSRVGEPDFTLLLEIGEPEIGCHPSLKDIETSLSVYLDMMS